LQLFSQNKGLCRRENKSILFFSLQKQQVLRKEPKRKTKQISLIGGKVE